MRHGVPAPARAPVAEVFGVDKHNVVMPSWVVRWLVNALALLVISFIPFRGGRLIEILGVGSVLLAAGAMGLINTFMRRIFGLFSLPKRDLTLAIFAVGANIVALLITDWVLGRGFGFHSGPLAVAVAAALLAAGGGVVSLAFGGTVSQ